MTLPPVATRRHTRDNQKIREYMSDEFSRIHIFRPFLCLRDLASKESTSSLESKFKHPPMDRSQQHGTYDVKKSYTWHILVPGTYKLEAPYFRGTTFPQAVTLLVMVAHLSIPRQQNRA